MQTVKKTASFLIATAMLIGLTAGCAGGRSGFARDPDSRMPLPGAAQPHAVPSKPWPDPLSGASSPPPPLPSSSPSQEFRGRNLWIKAHFDSRFTNTSYRADAVATANTVLYELNSDSSFGSHSMTTVPIGSLMRINYLDFSAADGSLWAVTDLETVSTLDMLDPLFNYSAPTQQYVFEFKPEEYTLNITLAGSGWGTDEISLVNLPFQPR